MDSDFMTFMLKWFAAMLIILIPIMLVGRDFGERCREAGGVPVRMKCYSKSAIINLEEETLND